MNRYCCVVDDLGNVVVTLAWFKDPPKELKTGEGFYMSGVYSPYGYKLLIFVYRETHYITPNMDVCAEEACAFAAGE